MLSEANAIAVAELVVYSPALAIAIFLCVRHGFKRSSGWRFLITFALARLIQAGMQLGTLAAPTNISLYIGISILLSIAISPLELTSLGLLSRLVTSINKTQATVVMPRHIRLLQLFNTIGLILGIVGGDISGSNVAPGKPYDVASETQASIGMFIATFVGILVICILLAPVAKHAQPGEKRILLAVSASLPFMAVRILYSSLFVYGNFHAFSIYGGSENILLGMALIMEFVVVVIYEGVGVTLKKLPKEPSEKEQEQDKQDKPDKPDRSAQSPLYSA